MIIIKIGKTYAKMDIQDYYANNVLKGIIKQDCIYAVNVIKVTLL